MLLRLKVPFISDPVEYPYLTIREKEEVIICLQQQAMATPPQAGRPGVIVEALCNKALPQAIL